MPTVNLEENILAMYVHVCTLCHTFVIGDMHAYIVSG